NTRARSPPVEPLDLCLQRPATRRALHSFPTRRSSDLPKRTGFYVVVKQSRSLFAKEALAVEPEGNFVQNLIILIFLMSLCHLFRSEEHTSELQSRFDLVCRLLLEKKNAKFKTTGEWRH